MRYRVRALLLGGTFFVAESPAVTAQDVYYGPLEQSGSTAQIAGGVTAGVNGGGGYVSVLVCRRDAEAGATAGPAVAFFERSTEEVEACMTADAPGDYCAAAAGIAEGIPCAEALATLHLGALEFLELETVQKGRPLLIVAEDVEGEALATLVPKRPHTDMVYLLGTGDGDGVLVGCDFFSRRNATLTMFDQVSGDSGATLDRLDYLADAPTCAQTLTHFASDGVPLRAKVAVSPGAFPARPDILILDESVTPGSDVVPDPEFMGQQVQRFDGIYYVTTVTHRFQ